VSSQSCAFEFSYSLVSLTAHAVAQRTVCATGFVPMSRRRRVGIVCIAPRHPPPSGWPQGGEPQGSPRTRPADLAEQTGRAGRAVVLLFSQPIAHLLVGFARQGAAQVA
jgi:hypothetical protein